MNWRLGLAAGVVVVSALGGACADEGPPRATPPVSPATLLYLDRPGWFRAEGARKTAIASDFMRVFCGDPGMPPHDLVDCLDRSEGNEPLFERALSCVAGVRSR